MSYFDKVQTAYAERRTAIEHLRELDEKIGDAEPNEEQRASFDKINADIDRLDAEMDKWLAEGKRQERSAFLDDLVGQQSDDGQRDERTGLTPIEAEVRQLALRKTHPEARDEYQFRASTADLHTIMRRDLKAGTATDGAELVPTTLYGQLYTMLREGATSMFSLGRDIVTQSGEAMDFPKNTSFSTAALVAEAAAISESDPQFATVTLNAYKYGLAIQISSELEEDEAVPGALPWVVDQAVDGIRRGVGAALVTADGSSKPNGVDNNSTTTSTATGVTFPTADNLIDAYHAIASPYRMNGVWVFLDATVAGIRKLKDGDNQYMWQPGLQAGQPDLLLGRPVHTDAAFAAVGANAKIGVFGDLKRGYLVRTVANIRAERSTDYAFLNDLNTWRFVGRFDGEIIDDTAYTVITNEAS